MFQKTLKNWWFLYENFDKELMITFDFFIYFENDNYIPKQIL